MKTPPQEPTLAPLPPELAAVTSAAPAPAPAPPVPAMQEQPIRRVNSAAPTPGFLGGPPAADPQAARVATAVEQVKTAVANTAFSLTRLLKQATDTTTAAQALPGFSDAFAAAGYQLSNSQAYLADLAAVQAKHGVS